jgi:hypothetical protein
MPANPQPGIVGISEVSRQPRNLLPLSQRQRPSLDTGCTLQTGYGSRNIGERPIKGF